ncbi:MAG: bile acid:sodium symporter family protein [Chitinispirillaceae bacterium]|nr:bile acid:sodium symporter family protein [Chitinispirillaceae bacterium]
MFIFLSILIGSSIALVVPDIVLKVKPALQPSFAVTMLFVGVLVPPEHVRVFLKSPTRPLIGVLAQYTIMPLAAFAVSLFFTDPLLRTGIVLVGCMPGAMASNVMTMLLKGDVILSVTMTSLATLLCPLVIAFWLPLLTDTRIAIQVGPMIWNAVWMVVLPVCCGIVLRFRLRATPPWLERSAPVIASAAITLIILVVVAANRSRLLELSASLAVAMLALNVAGYALAFTVGLLLRWPVRQRRTLMIEVGMQNAGLGSVLALTHLGEAGAVPSAFYTALCVLTASAMLPVLTKSSLVTRHR